MFRKFKNRISSATNAVMGSEDPKVRNLTAMGFEVEAAKNALTATNGDVDRAAELLLIQQQESGPTTSNQSEPSNSNSNPAPPSSNTQDDYDDDDTLQRVMQESMQMEEQRRAQNTNPPRTTTAAAHKAGQAAALRANGGGVQHSDSGDLSSHHPDVKLIPKLQDKSKEEQILRCADRMKNSPAAVDTLCKALSAVQQNPDLDKFRKVDKTTAGYQRSVAGAPGAEDLLHAMNYRAQGPDVLVLDRAMVDPALLYLGISALEQTKETDEYKQGKRSTAFAKAVRDMQMHGDSSDTEAIKRAEFMAKCPTEPPDGRGALMQVIIAEQTIRRRFDGDDQLRDVLHWLGGHGSSIPDKILSREWSLVDLNRYPVIPVDCSISHQDNTLQYIGCWPSGRLEIVMSTEDWMNGTNGGVKRGSSRGLGSAPSDAL
jgi:hypothetical protein